MFLCLFVCLFVCLLTCWLVCLFVVYLLCLLAYELVDLFRLDRATLANCIVVLNYEVNFILFVYEYIYHVEASFRGRWGLFSTLQNKVDPNWSCDPYIPRSFSFAMIQDKRSTSENCFFIMAQRWPWSSSRKDCNCPSLDWIPWIPWSKWLLTCALCMVCPTFPFPRRGRFCTFHPQESRTKNAISNWRSIDAFS